MTNIEALNCNLRIDSLDSFKSFKFYFDGINLPTKFPCWAWIINYEQINGERRPYLGYYYEEFLEQLTEIKK